MIIRLHNPFVSLIKPRNLKSAEIRTPLTYEERVREDRKATIMILMLFFASAILYAFLN